LFRNARNAKTRIVKPAIYNSLKKFRVKLVLNALMLHLLLKTDTVF